MRSRKDAKAALFEAERHGEIGGSAPARAALLRHVPHPDLVGEPIDGLLTAAVLRTSAVVAPAVDLFEQPAVLRFTLDVFEMPVPEFSVAERSVQVDVHSVRAVRRLLHSQVMGVPLGAAVPTHTLVR